jgi:uncharacterized protein
MEPTTSVVISPAVKVVKQAFADFANRNIKGILEACAEGVTFGGYRNPYIRPSGLYYGKDGVLEFFKILDQNFSYVIFEPEEFICQDDRVIVMGHEAGTVKSTGKTFDTDWCMCFTIRNGKIQNYFGYQDTYTLAQAFQ